jgi:spoIIIJ-associated protein
MEPMEFDGKDLDDALAVAALALGRPAAELDYEILEGGRKGVFGLGARPVRVRIAGAAPAIAPAMPLVAAPAVARTVVGPPSASSAPAAALATIFTLMGFQIEVRETRRDAALELSLDGPDRKRLTARDGELMSALEFVLARMGRRAWPDEPSVRLACQGFRPGKDDELAGTARQVASEVARTGRSHRLRAMNPYERRVVHMTVREFEGLTTVSEGDGFLKRVRVEKIAT